MPKPPKSQVKTTIYLYFVFKIPSIN